MDTLHPFILETPATVADALVLARKHPEARYLAGGTDLLPNLRRGIGAPPRLIDLSRIASLNALTHDGAGWTLGAGLTLARLASDAQIAAALPALAQAAAAVAGPGHRSVATLGGNLCLDTRCVYYNQSQWWRRANDHCLKLGGSTCHVAPQGQRCHAAFSGDMAPALIALDAQAQLLDPQGTRHIPLAAMYQDDGAQPLTLAPGELLVALRLPAQPVHARSGYAKARVRGAMDFPLAGVAMRVVPREDGQLAELRVGLTGTNSSPIHLQGTEALCGVPLDEALFTALGKLVRKQVSTMRSTVTSSNYRRQMAVVHAQRLLRHLLAPR